MSALASSARGKKDKFDYKDFLDDLERKKKGEDKNFVQRSLMRTIPEEAEELRMQLEDIADKIDVLDLELKNR
eukprot:CAMPEP_0114597032 /NCGR_PEP_ID=MMETSP0125-20121206/19257_1 /TAXON_ID=485358 ORGANISM="Aristerostoma sp., Strain ATCC 50986" /NCGR_SAMPLE_ID=MMETSP0125 /ASSEMBLY_ACC=CAM_ASM_000245 /LENGTH=72 /DNA_ID=CAMNT_0001801067 /DNA_START=1323 /DNA_END=1541 /DNA_ORIENTATION=-